jgi:uncharacterized protein
MLVVATVLIDLRVPGVSSLKGKRGVVKQLVAALRKELNVSVAEVGYQDKWQRTLIGVAIAAGSEVGVRKVAQQVEKIVYREHRVDIITIDVHVTYQED